MGYQTADYYVIGGRFSSAFEDLLYKRRKMGQSAFHKFVFNKRTIGIVNINTKPALIMVFVDSLTALLNILPR